MLNKEDVKNNAEQFYREGSFYCSEAVLKSVLEALDKQLSPEVVAMASGFPVGIGGAECTCGAISGGIMAIGYVFGRSEAADPKVSRCMQLSKELYDRFIMRNKCSCCKVLTRGMEKGSEIHMKQCIRFTGEVAADCYEIIQENI